ncbi:nucleotidyltransferase domain-containing protein, partial [Candidatus Dojkabacteria bacterium]|nr:nucleotidyltransferase domain-containing protein [Candidatus Dojkabacteria bacterium]
MVSVDDIFVSTKAQESLINKILGSLSDENCVIKIIQRGSFATGKEDRASDVDLLFVVEDDCYEKFLEGLNEKLKSAIDLVFNEGWIDTIVPNFGGIGFVYLAKDMDKLIQLDLYVTPKQNSAKILKLEEKRIIYSRYEYSLGEYAKKNVKDFKCINKQFIKNNLDQEFQIIFEVLLVIEMYAKHIYRGHTMLSCKYRYLCIESLARFLRYVHTPEKVGYLMYDWNHDFKNINDPIVKQFERNIQLIDIYSEEQVFTLIRIFKKIMLEHFSNNQREQYYEAINFVEEYIG